MAEVFLYPVCVEGQWDHITPKLRNKLIIYFQSKKSEGGDCDVYEDVSDAKTATVRFKKDEVRQRVLQKKTHELKIGQKNLEITVSLPQSQTSSAQESAAPDMGGQECEAQESMRPIIKDGSASRSVELLNLPNHSQDFLEMLVVNVLRGTSSKSCHFDLEVISENNCAVVMFSNDRDIENFMSSSTTNAVIQKNKMRVKLLEITGKVDEEVLSGKASNEHCGEVLQSPESKVSCNSRSAVLENLTNHSQDFLEMLVESVLKGTSSESSHFDLEIIPENNCAVVMFSSKCDLKNFILSTSTKSIFKRSKITVKLLEITSKVKAEGFPASSLMCLCDLLALYFEQFGEVEKVLMLEAEHSAIITFKNHKDVDQVLKEQHQIRKQPFRVLPYYESLQTALYGSDRPVICLPELYRENIDEALWKHLNESSKSLKVFTEAAHTHFCEMDLTFPAVKISPLPSLLQQGTQTRQLIQNWRETVSSYMSLSKSKFKLVEIQIQKDAWTEIKNEIGKILAADEVSLFLNAAECKLQVVGLEDDVARIEDVLKTTVEQISQKIQREKGSESTEIDISQTLYNLTLRHGLEQQICDKFPNLDLTYNANIQQLTIYGLKYEILETKNSILQEILGMIRNPVKLHWSVSNFLLKNNLEEMNKVLFSAEGIRASLEFATSGALLIGKTMDDITNGENQLKTKLDHVSFKVADQEILMSSAWQDLVSHLNAKVTGATIQLADNEVVVSGFVSSIKDAEKSLCDFLLKNTHVEKVLNAHKTVVQFIENNKQDWLEKVKGKVNVNFKDETIVISGSRLHFSECLPMFEKLLASAVHSIFSIAKPGAKQFFKEKMQTCVLLAKNDMGCVVHLLDQSHDSPQSGIKPCYVFKTPQGLEITVNKANMCSFPVEAVVCGCGERLELDTGLAKVLSEAAGATLQDSCNKHVKNKTLSKGDAVCFNAGGQLQCKHVIFAIAPHYNNLNPQQSESLLEKVVKRSLNIAYNEGFQSLAVPAISSSALGYPVPLCANIIVKAIKDFCDYDGGNGVLKKIHLVDNNDVTVQALENAVKKCYEKSDTGTALNQTSTSHQTSNDKDKAKVANFPGVSQSFQTNEGLTITLMKGNIEDMAMDVVVNTLSQDKNLNVGAISKALFTAAGPQLQVLLNQEVTGAANTGHVYETAAGNLKNKLVFHAVVPHWNQGRNNEQKVLEGVVDTCLDKAEQRQQSSLVLSAIGTGNLGFPKALVVNTMLDSVFKFSSTRSSKHVQEVVFSLHPKDAETIQVFSDEFDKRFKVQSASASNTSQDQASGFSPVTAQSGVHETMMGGVTIQVLQGDITLEKTDVIVNSCGQNRSMKSGVAKAIADAAGPTIEAECQQTSGFFNSNVIMTQAGNLQCKKIFHIIVQRNSVQIQQCVQNALRLCAKEKYTSISFPAIGTGQAGVSPDQVAEAMMDAVVAMVEQTPQSSLKLIRLVVFHAPMLNSFYQSMKKRETSKQVKSTSKIKTYAASVKSFFAGAWEKKIKQNGGKDLTIEGTLVDAVSFSVCGPSQAAVDQTKALLEQLISLEQVTQSISDVAILSFSEKDQQKIKDLQNTFGVKISLQYKASKGSQGDCKKATLVFQGLSRDVLKATQVIQEMIITFKDEEILNKEVSLMSEVVDWQYEHGGQYKSFDQRTNLELEKGLASQSKDTEISLHGRNHKIIFPEGPMVRTRDGVQIRIRRIDKLKVSESIPQYWDAMNPGDLLQMFYLATTSLEYQDVLNKFLATCPAHNVLTIQRIQNPGMWKNYQNNKSVMEKKNGHQNNENTLFHGTSEQTTSHINTSGFNRSYAGQNAAAFGMGTYFAVHAGYSAQHIYSVPNAQGHKHMYLCRVLTGDFTAGAPHMIVPPAKNSTCDLFDTVVDNPSAPTIFVVFRDDHAYPEYLITFT